MVVLKILNEENSSQDEIDTFFVSRSVRGIVFDNLNNIALIHARNNRYYELPGGGVEKGETLEEGLIREIKEEAGCDVEIIETLGVVEEIRKRSQQVHRSTCFTAKVVEEKGQTQMTAKEIGEGKEVVWVSVKDANNYIQSSDVKNDLYHTYVMKRDMTFLEALDNK